MAKQVDSLDYGKIRQAARRQGFDMAVIEKVIDDCKDGDIHARCYLCGFLRDHDAAERQDEHDAERMAENGLCGFD